MEKETSPDILKKIPIELFKVKDFTTLNEIRFLVGAQEVKMGQLNSKDTTVFSYGANPCISGLIIGQDNHLYCFHSLGSEFTGSQKEIILSAAGGIVGGGIESINKYESVLKKSKIQIIYPPTPKHDFNFVLIKPKNKPGFKPGLYSCYDTIGII